MQGPIRRRAIEAPAYRVRPFDFDDEEWPHPGENDNGPITRLFAEMAEWYPSELRDGDWFQHPTREQLDEMLQRSQAELQVCVEQYLKGLERGRRWSDPRMEDIYQSYLGRSMTLDELKYVMDYAIEEHRTDGS
jgi:hypothetical protein